MAPLLPLMVFESCVQAAAVAATAGGEEVWGPESPAASAFFHLIKPSRAPHPAPVRGPPLGGWASCLILS